MGYSVDFLTGGSASATSDSGPTYDASKAVDDNESTLWGTPPAIGMPQSWAYDLGSGVTKTARRLRMKPYDNANGGYIKDWELGGSNLASPSLTTDGDWTTVTSGQHADDDAWETYDFANAVAYRHYRIKITDNWRPSYQDAGAYEFEMMELSPESAEITETITLDDSWTILTNPEQASLSDTITLDDSWTITTNPEQASLTDTITLDDSWTVTRVERTDYISKIISYNPLVFVTNTDPAKIAEVDISTPTVPVKDVYTITGCKNARGVVLNDTSDYFYVLCAEGKVAKIEKADLSNQTVINTGESDTLQLGATLEDFFLTYIGTDDTDGEIVVIDERTVDSINTDLRYIQRKDTLIFTRLDYLLGSTIDTDFRWRATNTSTINTDLRWLKYSYATASQYPTSDSDIQVKINGTDLVPLNDVNMRSIVIEHTIDESSIASFVLNRRHDKLDYRNDDVASEITNQNAVIIIINGNTEFTGTISNLSVQSETETVQVTAKGDQPSYKKNSVNIPMASVGDDAHLYHCFMHNVIIDNPSVETAAIITNSAGQFWTGSEWTGDRNDAQEFNTFTIAENYIEAHSLLATYTSQEVFPTNKDERPEYYNGIYVNLGIEETENVYRYTGFENIATLADDVESGDFSPKINWSYYWFAKARNFVTGTSWATLKYLGTSLGTLSTDTWGITGLSYKRQKILDNELVDLGFYTVEYEPFLEISTKSGRFVSKYKWEDRSDGLYNVKGEAYDYEQFAKDVADLEYEKLKNINGNILPITSTALELSIDGYYYYSVKLLTRINVTNTTTTGIYNASNGFPVGVKGIRITTSNMKVNLTCDNQKALVEMNDLDDTYPDENSDQYKYEAKANKINSKYDITDFGNPSGVHFTIEDFKLDDFTFEPFDLERFEL